jgi:hypothetical protein
MNPPPSRQSTPDDRPGAGPSSPPNCRAACPACGGSLVEVKAKLVCSRCRAIIETCCEGGPG